MKSSEPRADLGKALEAWEGNTALEPTDIIRTETILSKLPLHQLAKRGGVPIRIVRRSADGSKTELHWEVRPNPITGEPRALAYKLDTIVINRRLDELGQDFPRLLKLGSLHHIAEQLGLARDTNSVRKALEQNADTTVIAKFNHKTSDGGEREFEARNTRYGIYFWRSTLPDGTKSDSVYLSFNDPFYQLLRDAPRRPLDYEYLKLLPPAAQRFYELVSFQIFAAIKNGAPDARLRYSEYCTFASQTRYFDRAAVQKQMYKVHLPHKKSGYIAAVAYDAVKDESGKPDWLLRYRPGPKAWAEHSAFNKRGRKAAPGAEAAESAPTAAPVMAPAPSPTAVDDELFVALTSRGILEQNAHFLLADLTGEKLEHIGDCIEYWEAQKNAGAGLLHDLIAGKIALPKTFITRADRRVRDEAERERRRQDEEQVRADLAYKAYERAALDQYLTTVAPDRYQALLTAKEADLRQKHAGVPAPAIPRLAELAVRSDLRQETTILSFEEFSRQQGRGEQSAGVATDSHAPRPSPGD